ncbi:protein ECERIFERUM 1-like protein [Cinnamomum micranthum f. kanehirae]|uniref:Protein ECERIFERUM 1-like protein n=1 Tax=Cinnamomum micranthum f. kanehirae TaxID=337451 RepID=A0A3S3M018_9MAGN|nr:protein ECERIFERUM 1-like protein [Cinnamomum micranthum f. kanehirae]
MASKPGLFSEWPWKKLGNFKYVILAPWVAHSLYAFMTDGEKDMLYMLIFPIHLWRWLHSQIWISFARFQTARTKHLIVSKGIDFEQVDRERNWDDQIILSGISMYVLKMLLDAAKNIPLWRTDGAVLTVLLHMGPVEFLYYWFHRALHHHFLYSRYHSHHHSSIATEPITSVVHPFAEMVVYFILFSIPMLTATFTGTASVIVFLGYFTYIDFMNNMGHCNFELVPKWLFTIFPFLKYFMYTPTFHSLHHTQFRTNYSLFMPIYDYVYGTMDKSSDTLYETMLKGKIERPQVVHLTHPTTLQSIYHLRLGFADVASKPFASKWYLWMLLPLTCGSMFVTWIYGSTFTLERNKLDKLKMQTWAIPRYNFQYLLSWQRTSINNLIGKAILKAEEEGVKVISLGLLNQGEALNRNGELFLLKHPKLNIRIVNGSSLAVAIVLNSIPQGTKQVFLRGNLSKRAFAIALGLCQGGIQVITVCKAEFERLKLQVPDELASFLVYSKSYTPQVWIVGDGLREEEQKKAPKGSCFIPFSQFPVKKIRKDCTYFTTPAMLAPKGLENMHSCENWLPRRMMSAERVTGIVHALEGWDEHECGDTILDVEKVWNATLQHGFLPLIHM